VRRVDSPQHSRALRADKGANGSVYVGGTSLLAVETLFVCRLGGLDVSDGKGELVILLPLPQCGLRHPWAKHLCVLCLTFILLAVSPMDEGQLGENGTRLSPSVLALL